MAITYQLLNGKFCYIFYFMLKCLSLKKIFDINDLTKKEQKKNATVTSSIASFGQFGKKEKENR